jgi:hypothetical protein
LAKLICYLTAKERLLLERQAKALLKRCMIHDEDHVIDDDPKHRKIRAELFAPTHPVLKRAVTELARRDSTEAEIGSLLSGADLKDVSTEDMLEITFLLGPVGMTSLIFEMLTKPVDRDALDLLAELSELRHHMLFVHDSSHPAV